MLQGFYKFILFNSMKHDWVVSIVLPSFERCVTKGQKGSRKQADGHSAS